MESRLLVTLDIGLSFKTGL